MLRTGIIKELFPEQSGISKKTNEPWSFTPVLIEWKEDVGKIEPETHTAVVNLKGKKNAERIKLAIVKQECVPVEIYFNAKSFTRQGESQPRAFNDVRGYIGKEFDLTL